MIVKTLIFMAIMIPTLTSAKVLDFIVNVPFLTPKNSNVFLTGDLQELCNWKTHCLKMNSIGNGSYALSVKISDQVKKFHYKISRGSWETEAADSYSKAYNEIAIDIDKIDSTIVQNVIHWKDLSPLYKSLNVVGPFNLYSPELEKNKEISVYLPSSYHSSNKFYPVIYIHDGQNIFDPLTSSFGVSWALDVTMNKLIAENKMNEAIIVAIHTNNTDRWIEYDYFLKGKNYSDFVVNGVIPYIENNFKVLKNRNARYLMGSSMGALISLMMLIDRPDIFSKGAGLSFPAFINNRAIFKFLEAKVTLPSFEFYMDHGDYGIDAKYALTATELYQALSSRGIAAKYLTFPYADHTEADWARRAYIPLEYLLNH